MAAAGSDEAANVRAMVKTSEVPKAKRMMLPPLRPSGRAMLGISQTLLARMELSYILRTVALTPKAQHSCTEKSVERGRTHPRGVCATYRPDWVNGRHFRTS